MSKIDLFRTFDMGGIFCGIGGFMFLSWLLFGTTFSGLEIYCSFLLTTILADIYESYH